MFDYLSTSTDYDVKFLFVQWPMPSKLMTTVLENMKTKYGEDKVLFLRSSRGLKHYYSSSWVFSDGYVAVTKPLGNQKVVQLWHGYIGKRIGYLNPSTPDETSLFRWTTSVFTTQSSFLALQFIAEFGLSPNSFVLTSSPRFDLILPKQSKDRAFNALSSMGIDTSYKHLVLAAPTFRRDRMNNVDPHSSFNIISHYLSEDVEKFLVENDILLVLKPHQTLTKYPEYLNKLSKERENIVFIDNSMLYSNLLGITNILPAFDALITDYSSVFVDYLLLNRPVIFYVPDYEDAIKSLGYTVNFDTYTPGPKVKTVNELISAIEAVLFSEKDPYLEKRKCIRDVLIEKWYPEDNTKILLKDIGFL
ncbi:CDP-glycerol glycerophosphotransferase family protein [Thermococcus profundus]|uniref:CDP-glycerol glycerophosphotransferase family protein n=1 Tax=Thermococcus profundus TaxID=49899 RepID=UPI001E4DAA45|nr:CDP-glycerol glycerophosphotransferase family protein [Thermococcus profundus]